MTPAGVMVARMEDRHAGAVLAIYRAGIEEGNATFETEPPDWERFTATRLARHHGVWRDVALVERRSPTL